MGRSIYEKILARVSGREYVRSGEVVWAKPDLIAVTDLNWSRRETFLRDVGLERVPKPEKIVAVVDHHTEQLAMPEGAEHLKRFRSWAKENRGVHFYDAGRGGLMTQVLAEKGHVLPGMLIISDDPEAEACGALGALIRGSNQLMWMAAAIDRVWLEVPDIVKCFVEGQFQKGVSSIDLRYKLNRDLGESFGKFLEFCGPAIDESSIDSRMNLCSCLHLIGSCGIINPDEKTIVYIKGRSNEAFDPVVSDPDAEYSAVKSYDVSKLEPQIAFPPSPSNTRPVTAATGIEIHQACVGSCASGRMEDLRIVAEILIGRKVHPRVRMFITPASQEILSLAVQEGLINVFVEAGAVLSVPSCGTCPGHIGRLAAGEVCVSTGTVNYAGRMGSEDAEIYLASPATVAASAVLGEIADPRQFFSRKEVP